MVKYLVGGVGQIPTFLRDEKGNIFVNPAKDFVIPFDLYTDPRGTPPTNIVTVGAGLTVGPLPMSVRSDGPFEGFYQVIRATSQDMTVFLEHPARQKFLMNRPIHIGTLMGDGGRSAVLPETVFIPAIEVMLATFQNLDTQNAQDIEFGFEGIKMLPNKAFTDLKKEMFSYIQRRERTYPYWQTSDDDIVVPGGAVNQDFLFTVPSDADLEVFKVTSWTDADGVDIRGRVYDGNEDRAMSNSPGHLSLVAGGMDATALAGLSGDTGGIYPKRYATSWLIRRGTTFKVQLSNPGQTDVRVYLTFWGRKIQYS